MEDIKLQFPDFNLEEKVKVMGEVLLVSCV